MSLASKIVASPVGLLTLVASQSGLLAVLWENDRLGRVPLQTSPEQRADPVLAEAEQQLNEYFEGQRTTFDLPLDLRGTEFQRAVWTYLRSIPFGATRTYGEIARELGNPNAMRAVGAANGRNPVSIIVPCHRVIGSSGTLTGFAGGVSAKAWLLQHEAGTAEFTLTAG